MLLAAGWLLGGMAVGGFFFTLNLRNPLLESAVGPPIRTLATEMASWFGCLPPPYLSLDELTDGGDGIDMAIEMNEMDLRRLALSDQGGLLQNKRVLDLPQAGSGLTPRPDW